MDKKRLFFIKLLHYVIAGLVQQKKSVYNVFHSDYTIYFEPSQ